MMLGDIIRDSWFFSSLFLKANLLTDNQNPFNPVPVVYQKVYTLSLIHI